jgi:lipid II:glycine glycyltransferase (peptidoglycan interpeptide bridge formation enzyme)
MTENAWRAGVDQATDSEWSTLLELFDDANIYQTAAYGATRWGAGNLSRLVLRRGDEVKAIAQLRVIQPTPLKFGIAYLRWGPLWERRGCDADPEAPAAMARALHEEYVVRRKLFLRIVPNAFSGSVRAAAFQSAFFRFDRQVTQQNQPRPYRTLVVDLSSSLDEIRSGLDKKWRNQLNRAEKNGLTVVVDDGTAAYSDFCGIYTQMRERKGFETTVDVEEFGRIQKALPSSQRMRVLLCCKDGAVVAGVVASAMGNSAIYLLGATSDDGLDAKGAYVLQWTLIRGLKEQGARWYDLGGIDPETNPGVYHFKKGLSGSDVCQIAPLTASGSFVSSMMAGAGSVLQRAVRGSSKRLNSGLLKEPATRA